MGFALIARFAPLILAPFVIGGFLLWAVSALQGQGYQKAELARLADAARTERHVADAAASAAREAGAQARAFAAARDAALAAVQDAQERIDASRTEPRGAAECPAGCVLPESLRLPL